MLVPIANPNKSKAHTMLHRFWKTPTHPHYTMLMATLLGVLGLLQVGHAQAQALAYPSKPIRLIIPFPAGGATDVLGRAISIRLGEKLGTSIVVDNKPGAGGTIGSDLAAKAVADGYTLLLATSSTHSIAPTLNPKLNYDPDGDFTPIAHVANAPNVVLVPLSSPAKNIEQFVALAKSKPGALNYASSGNGTVVHLQTELFKSMSSTFITHIPYRGTALAIPDLISGKIDLLIDSIPSALPHIHGGKVRALAVTSRQRTALMGDLPTVAETLKGYEAVTWFGLFAPKHLSPELTARINTAINEALAEPELRAQLNRLGAEAVGGTPQAFATHYRREREQWKKVIAERKITAE